MFPPPKAKILPCRIKQEHLLLHPPQRKQQMCSVCQSFATRILNCWVKSATLMPLQIAVEKAPLVAVQLLIDSKKLVGSLRS